VQEWVGRVRMEADRWGDHCNEGHQHQINGNFEKQERTPL
jgi:hypothetical protein